VRISVIVTTYNNPDYLGRVLEGFNLQRRLPDEILVADDGSGPETAECIGDFSGRAAFPVRHVWHEDRGFRLASIRNKAIKEAVGDYVVIMDGDCIAGRHFVSDHERLAMRGFFVQGKRVLVGPAASEALGQESVNSFISTAGMLLSGEFSNTHHLIRLPWLPPLTKTVLRGIKGCNMAFWRDDLLAVNGYNEAFIGWGREDSEIAVRLYRYGLKRHEHPFMACCYHLWHPENRRDMLEENDRILEDTIKSGSFRCSLGIEKDSSGQ